MHLTLYLPAACMAAEGGSRDLARLLARADRLPESHTGDDAALCALFHRSLSADPPVAALGAWGLGLDDTCRHWLRADPVHLQPARDDLVVTPVADLTAAEAQDLVTPLAAHLRADGITLYAGTPTCWSLTLPAPARLRTTPLTRACGHPMGLHLPQGEDARPWLARLTEMQMLLHEHPRNAARERAGKMAVNGLWLWGEGQLPTLGSAAYDAVYGEDALTRGLARASGMTALELPERFAQLARAPRVLVNLGALSDTPRLDAQWVAPLQHSLADGTLDEAVLLVGGSPTRNWRVRPWHRWRIWRRATPGGLG